MINIVLRFFKCLQWIQVVFIPESDIYANETSIANKNFQIHMLYGFYCKIMIALTFNFSTFFISER